jgi:ribosomal protein S12 methylthiotransferase
MRLGLVSLGCDKNTVDSERMLGYLVGHGARPVEDLRDAEVILVNTCGFIDAAKEESIETLLEAARLKQDGECRSVVAVGCLVERYRAELEEALPEVDLFLGLRDIERLAPELQARGLLSGPPAKHPGERLALGSRHVSYLKVSEGCDHGCAFCAIPLWRGRHRSFGIEQLVAEAQRLEIQGAVELNLVAQDLAHFGRDRRDGSDITALVRALLAETDIPWFRLLYIYSAGLREPLAELMATESRLLPYIDMPIQHASDPVLVRMRRPERRAALRAKIAWLRDSVPHLTLRTTVMVGFPGESEEDFHDLLDFLDEVRFDRLGAFAFSPQEGTRAADLGHLYVDEDVAQERLAELLEIQRAISAERLTIAVGRLETAIVDQPQGRAGDSDGRFRALGRLASQADDVDGVTELFSQAPLATGTLVEAEIVSSDDFDVRADVLRVVREPSVPARPRELPVVALGLETAWGR